nr:hypothetical protein Itr_chr10CG02290 [Ipomoea trifida]
MNSSGPVSGTTMEPFLKITLRSGCLPTEETCFVRRMTLQIFLQIVMCSLAQSLNTMPILGIQLKPM